MNYVLVFLGALALSVAVGFAVGRVLEDLSDRYPPPARHPDVDQLVWLEFLKRVTRDLDAVQDMTEADINRILHEVRTEYGADGDRPEGAGGNIMVRVSGGGSLNEDAVR